MTADHLWEDQVGNGAACRCGHVLDAHRAVVRVPGKGWGLLDGTPGPCQQAGCTCPRWAP